MKLIFVVISALFFSSCSMTTYKGEKINGLSYVAFGDSIRSKHVQPVVAVNANYAAIMPYSYIRDMNDPEVKYGWERGWFGETRAGVAQSVEELRRSGIKIMLKPHLWASHGQYTGLIEMDNEAKWKTFEETYRKYIMDNAELAEKLRIEIFCIGTELDRFVQNRKSFWNELITELRTVYSGKLTYASNWDEFGRVPFWEELDLIGIDAYFPLSENQTPSVKDCKLGWKKYKPLIEELAHKSGKPVLFTEFGYRSLDYAAREPWRSERSLLGVNHQAQLNATQALFDEFWNESWFAGGFVWKWFPDGSHIDPENNTRFSPQNKPVEAVIRETYGLY